MRKESINTDDRRLADAFEITTETEGPSIE